MCCIKGLINLPTLFDCDNILTNSPPAPKEAANLGSKLLALPLAVVIPSKSSVLALKTATSSKAPTPIFKVLAANLLFFAILEPFIAPFINLPALLIALPLIFLVK